MSEKVTVVIPAFNEENSIDTVLKNVKIYVDEIIVIDDASTDKTYEIAKQNSAIVIRHDKNQGYDKCLDDGFKEAAKRKASIILSFDADGQHIPEDILNIIAPIKNGKIDVVVGIRPYKQRISEMFFSYYAKKKIGIQDPLCGIKAYSVEAYKTIGYFDQINSIGTELLFNCFKYGYQIQEVHINMNKREGTPRFGSIIKANLKIFYALLKIYHKFG